MDSLIINIGMKKISLKMYSWIIDFPLSLHYCTERHPYFPSIDNIISVNLVHKYIFFVIRLM